jgi:hypothetical protein
MLSDLQYCRACFTSAYVKELHVNHLVFLYNKLYTNISSTTEDSEVENRSISRTGIQPYSSEILT